MDLPTTCPCGGAYAYQNDRLVCAVCGVPAGAPPAQPRPGESAANAALRQATERWADYEQQRAALVERRLELHGRLKMLAAKTEDTRLQLHQADSRLVALDRTKGGLAKELADCRRDAEATAARGDRDKRRASLAAVAELRESERRAAELDTQAAESKAVAGPPPLPADAAPEPAVPPANFPAVAVDADGAVKPVNELSDPPSPPPARSGRRR